MKFDEKSIPYDIKFLPIFRANVNILQSGAVSPSRIQKKTEQGFSRH